MRVRTNKHKIKSDTWNGSRLIRDCNTTRTFSITGIEGRYKKEMCETCKYYKGKCEKDLRPLECAKKGEKYKWDGLYLYFMAF